jgi:phage baseplate assembly protein W
MKSLKIPFNFVGGKTQTTSSVTTIAEQKIVDVLTTGKFERVMRHRYGSDIRRLLFDQLDSLSLADFIIDARQDAADAISRVSILDIRVSPTNTIASYGNPETTLGITVIYRLPLGSPQVVRFSVAVPSELTEDSLI